MPFHIEERLLRVVNLDDDFDFDNDNASLNTIARQLEYKDMNGNAMVISPDNLYEKGESSTDSDQNSVNTAQCREVDETPL